VTEVAFTAQQAADQTEQDRLLTEAAETSADTAKALVSDTEQIQADADAALSTAEARESVLGTGVETEEEARERLENGNILDMFKVSCKTRVPVIEEGVTV